MESSSAISSSDKVDEYFIPPSQRPDAPLAGIIPKELEGIDPKKFFPDYDPEGILRFSRIFASNVKSTMRNQIWWTSRTFRKGPITIAEPEKSAEAEEAEAIDALEKAKQKGHPAEAHPSTSSGWDLNIGDPPLKEQCCTDEYELLCAENLDEILSAGRQAVEEDEESAPPWRYGPAQIWYDRMGVAANSHNFDYGFKKRAGAVKTAEASDQQEDNTFLPVNLIHWEDDIIIDGEEAKQKLIKELSSVKLPRCGWIPTPHTRTYKSFITAWKNKTFLEYLQNPMRTNAQANAVVENSDSGRLPIDSQHSLFPFDNYELENTRWEDDIIWDSANMPSIPKPRVLTLDYEDDPKAFGMPDDVATEDADYTQQMGGPKSFGKQEHGGIKKSKLILAQVFKRQRQEEEEQIETQIAQIVDKDPFNLSNDDYYLPRANARAQRSLINITIQHSTPAQNIHPTLFPYLATGAQLRHFHRPKLSRKVLQGTLGRGMPVHSLTRHIRMASQRREGKREGGGGFDIFSMRELHDLTGRDGTILLLEYSEEHPPLLSQPGMASKIRNYYKRKPTKEQELTDFEFGETAFTHTTPFLGNLSSHESLQALENNMYRATIFRHREQGTDFLLVRNKYGLFIRPFPSLFLAAQQLPLYEVPSPNSKRAKEFNRDFIMSYIYRLFWESEETPKRLKMDDLKHVFPSQESYIRKSLKQCAEMKKMSGNVEYWLLKEDFRLPSKEEVAHMVTPEMYCAQASMVAAEQRLKDAGYGEKHLHLPENADDSDDQMNIAEDEIKCAPWNTTRAYISVVRGKCFLDQAGIADPTGSGLGFSFVRVSSKPQKVREETDKEAPKKLVTGTNADLRKLSLKEARQMCREFGLTEEEINSLERWDVIDVIRTMSTQAAQGRTDSQGVARFARGNARQTFADMQNKHKEYCQRVFERQNEWLASQETETDGEHWEMGQDKGEKRFAGMYSTTSSLSDLERKKWEFEREEQERLNLQKMIRGEVSKGGGSTVSAAAKETMASDKNDSAEGPQDTFVIRNPQSPSNISSLLASSSGQTKRLKIYRTIKNSDGTESIRVETITHSQLIEAYVRIRSTRDDSFIKVYAQMDEKYKEEKRKERRRQQESVRRAKKGTDPKVAAGQLQQQKEKEPTALLPPLPTFITAPPAQQQQQTKPKPTAQPENVPKPKKAPPEKKEKPPPPPPKQQKELKITCSACGAIGHMKTNRNCPLYGKEDDLAHKTVGEICQPSASKLGNVPDESGNRLPSGELIEVEGTRLKISKKLYKHAENERKNALRLHIPRKILESGAAKKPAKKKAPPKAADAVKVEPSAEEAVASTSTAPPISVPPPMEDSQAATASKQRSLTINISASAAQPSVGPLSALSSASGGAPSSAGPFKRRGTLDEADYLLGPQKSVHRRRADPRVSMASVLMEILNDLKAVQGSEHFAFPVNIKKVPDYLDIVKKPMDLQQIRKNVSENKYELRQQFLTDLTQIVVNSITYNGPTHLITEAARQMLQFVTKKLEEHEQKLIEMEKQINPLLDDNDMVGFSHILLQIIEDCKNLPKSAAFHSRVDPKKFPQYNEKIQRPMDLGTIEQNIKEHRYTSLAAFRKDIQQIYANSVIFNGAQSAYTLKAAEIVALSHQLIERSQDTLSELEANIQKALNKNRNDDGSVSSLAAEEGTILDSWISDELGAIGQPGDIGEEQPIGAVAVDGHELASVVRQEEGRSTGAEETVPPSEGTLPVTDVGPPPDIAVPSFYVGDEEEETTTAAREEADAEAGVLQEDLAMSNDEGGEGESAEEDKGEDWKEAAVRSELLQSEMHHSGQLNADLALSDSDEEDSDGLSLAKRPRMDDLHESL